MTDEYSKHLTKEEDIIDALHKVEETQKELEDIRQKLRDKFPSRNNSN
jgi:hypothetical protein